MDRQKWLNQFCCELQLKPVHWENHNLLALAFLHPSQGVRTSPPLYRGTCTSEHSGDTIDGQSFASVWYAKWIQIETVAEIKTGLNTHLFHSTLCRSVSGFGVWLSHDTPFWTLLHVTMGGYSCELHKDSSTEILWSRTQKAYDTPKVYT